MFPISQSLKWHCHTQLRGIFRKPRRLDATPACKYAECGAFASYTAFGLGEVVTGTVSVWWRHDTETLSALMTLCEGSPSPVVDSPHKGPVVLTFGAYFVVNLLSSQDAGD